MTNFPKISNCLGTKYFNKKATSLPQKSHFQSKEFVVGSKRSFSFDFRFNHNNNGNLEHHLRNQDHL